MKRAIIFDFGGVMAEEGFQEGLKAIARQNGLDEQAFFQRSRDLIYETGYVTGNADEHTYWEAVREEFGITRSDDDLRKQILERFVPRPEMFEAAADLRYQGFTVALLSDQTDWLNQLDREKDLGISTLFHIVFNSYDLHMSKREPAVFRYVEKALNAAPKDIVFVDDNPENVRVAADLGWHAMLFLNHQQFRKELPRYLEED